MAKPIERLVNLLDQLTHHHEFPENPGMDLITALPALNLSPTAKQHVTKIQDLGLDELFGESYHILKSQLDVLRLHGYPVDVANDYTGLGRKRIVIYTVKGAIEL